MNPADLVNALLEAQATAARQALLIPRDDDFYTATVGLLKDRVDDERLHDPNAALAIAGIAIEVADSVGIPRCRALAAWAKGNVLIHQGDYAECLRLYQYAAELFAAEGMEINVGRLEANQAFVLKNLGRYDEGVQAAKAALDILKDHPSSIFLGGTLNALATLYWLLGRYDDALATYAESEKVYETQGEKVRRARVIINKANVLESLDRFEEAINLLNQARSVLADHEQFLEVARADLNLGIIYTRLGRYDEALETLDRAEKGFIALDIALEATVVSLYRADLYAEFNLYEELLQTSVQDWQIFEERQMQWQAARAIFHQAVAWRQLGDVVQAGELLRRAQMIFDQIGDEVWSRLVSLEQAALWCEQPLEPAASQDVRARALSVAEEAAVFFHEKGMPIRAAGGCLLAAECHLALDHFAAAVEHYQEVLDLAAAFGVHALLYRAHHGLGRVAAEQGRLQGAYKHFRQAIEAVESQRQQLRVEDFRLGFLEDKLQIYRDAVLLCLRMGLDDEAFAYVERAKSGALVDLLVASLSHCVPAPRLADENLIARPSAIREKLNWHYKRLEGTDGEERGPRSPHAEVKVLQNIAELEREASQAWRELQRTSPFYATLDHPAVHMPSVAQTCLRRNEVLLQYYEAGETIHVFIVGGEGLRASLSLTCTSSQLRDAVRALDTTLRGTSGFDRGYVSSVLCPLSQQQLSWLYDDLLVPLEPFLDGTQQLMIAPDGILFEVPFHALYNDDRYLMERYEIAYTPSAGTLRLCQENRRRHGTCANQALIMGYARDDELPYVRQEIEAVARAIPGAMIFTDDDASLACLQEHAGQSTLLHLAMHAVFRQDNPFFSALQISSEDWLRVMDLYSLRLNGALVILSGCETGRHRLLGGDLLGLSRGFFSAGASALVVSLWPVDDVSTAILMEQFYRHLAAGEVAASALRRAQQALRCFEEARDGQRVRPYAHPFYWAPFCLLGTPDMHLA